MVQPQVKKDGLLYPELSYEIIGLLFGVYNEIGYGHKEQHYENAVEEELRNANILFQRQLHAPLIFNNKKNRDILF